MSLQYLRNLSLTVARASGEGLELGAFRVVFVVRRGDIQTPNTADVRVYNVSEDTANTISNEFSQLELKVSYGDATPQRIFFGSIRQIRKGRENQLNSYVDITAADADEAYNFSVFARTLASGSTVPGTVESMIAAMAAGAQAGSPTGAPGGQPITKGYIPTLTTNPAQRGKVYYGKCIDILRGIAASNNCKVTVQDGAVSFIPLTAYIPGEAVVITPGTGLIGVPEQTQNGLSMRILLNPSVKIGQLVKLESPAINQLRFGLDKASAQLALQLTAIGAIKLNGQGLYYVMRAEHSGDTRGEAWYTDLNCLAVDASIDQEAVKNAAVTPVFPAPRDAILPY